MKTIAKKILLSLLAVITMTVIFCFGAVAQKYEPTKTIELGSSVSGKYEDYKSVYLEFKVKKPGKVTFKFSTTPEFADGSFHWEIISIDSDKNSIKTGAPGAYAFDDHIGGKITCTKVVFLEKGSYLLSFYCRGNGKYKITSKFEQYKESFSETVEENNDSAATASEIVLGKTYYGIIGLEDKDVYKFTVPKSGRIDFLLRGYANQGFLDYKIYNEKLKVVSEEYYYYDLSIYMGPRTTGFSNKAFTPGTYYLSIENAADREYSFAVSEHKHTYENDCDRDCNSCKKKREIKHKYTTTKTVSTIKKNGRILTKCSICGNVKSDKVIYSANDITLSAKSFNYDGKVQTPTVKVRNGAGKTLKKDTDYTLKYEKGRKLPGKYAVTVTLKGNYSGTKTLYFTIIPGLTKKVSATQSTSGIKLSWAKVTGATGYRIFCVVNGSWKKVGDTTKLSYTVKDLKAGTNYSLAVRPYTVDGKYTIFASSYTKINTATKCVTPTLKVTSTKKGIATLAWTNVAGESGYEVYGSSKKDSGYKKIATTNVNVAKASKNNLTSKKTYYFKVRAYKTVGDQKIYSALSAVKSVKIK